ncbi:hypothetical protein Gorai_003818 [Gossypium raimondii]|uniref:Uncharacterized protein n=1 Tax=Gossypium raimondii TaxID=29730 RepID=A0A7J8QQ32_GOSRA|nr:hypothetical protein [Gossypium raimondii]
MKHGSTVLLTLDLTPMWFGQ